ncbi:MAG: nicotinate phosphoribosyltransferase [Nitrospirota bacterium]
MLLTDLYQLTMLQAYVEQGMEETAVFEFFSRRLPAARGFLLAAGLEQLVDYLENLRFTPAELDWVRVSGRFSRSFVDYLERLRFTGDLHAMPEGTVCFPHEPLVRVTAPLPQAQLVETRLINLLHLQTVIASKAARSVLAAGGKPLVDFGLRRAHGAEAGVFAARASYLAGFAGTATVEAGVRFGIPLYGTMAHSFVQAHRDETEAFEHFAQAQPDNLVLLLDTYDTEAAARKVVALAPSLARQGITIKGVRLDSGDLADHARKVRRILDEGGLPQVQIIASGNLEESALQRFLTAGAPIDSFAVGTIMTTSADAPYLDCAYKLMEYAGRPCRKRSEGKATWPGRKQVYRRYGADGRIAADLVTLADDPQEGEPLLRPVMSGGKRLARTSPLSELRARAAAQLTRLPEPVRRLEEGETVPVRISSALQDLVKAVDDRT